MKKITTVIFASLICAAGLFAQKTPSVATVNVQRVLNGYIEYSTAVEKIRGSVAPVEEEMKKMQESIQELVAEGQEAQAKANNPALGEEARQEAAAKVSLLQTELQSQNQTLQQFRQQAQQLAQQGQQQDLQPLQQKALETVQQVAQDKGIDLVLPSNTVVYADESMDISDAVIAILNAEAGE